MPHYETIVNADGSFIYVIDNDEVDEAAFLATLAADPFEQAAAAARQAEADRLAALAAPLTPAPIEGDTVEDVKASAEASIADLAQQMTDRLALIIGSN
jgi:hypothetical protein